MANTKRRAVITGGSSGLGAATAGLLRDAGCSVINIDRNGGDIVADLGTQEGRIAAAREVEALLPDGFDVLICCAAIMGPWFGGPLTSAVNFFGTTRLAELLRPLLAKGTDPRALTVSSIASTHPYDSELLALYLAGDEEAAIARSDDWSMAYCTGKRAICHWTRATAIKPEWAGSGILLNGAAPGLIDTPMTQDYDVTSTGAKDRLHSSAPIALDHYATADEIAPLLVFLASPENSYMVGQVVPIDGGNDVIARGAAIP